jgi:hypothetical protein
MALDNLQLRDGLANPFILRSKDVSAAGDGTIQRTMVLATPYPMDFGVGGSFHHTAKNGAVVMAAGLAASAPIYSFRNPSSLLSIVKRVKIAAWTTVGFTAGIATFDMLIARAFTAADTGGTASTLTGDNATLRTSLGTAGSTIMHSNTATLTPGTRTLDVGAVESWNTAAPVAASTPFNNVPMKLFEKLDAEHPLVLAQNEGFVIQATVPAVGTWSWSVTTEWDEVPQY